MKNNPIHSKFINSSHLEWIYGPNSWKVLFRKLKFVHSWHLSYVYILAGWHASAVSSTLGNGIFGLLACLLNDVTFCLHQEYPTYPSVDIDYVTMGQGEKGRF
jgi:hypothetical protein